MAKMQAHDQEHATIGEIVQRLKDKARFPFELGMFARLSHPILTSSLDQSRGGWVAPIKLSMSGRVV